MPYNRELFTGLLLNATLLLALSIVHEAGYLIPVRNKKHLSYINGIIIGVIGIGIMSVPFVFQEGIIFDTRSILISVTALIFGTVPAVIALVITASYRIIQGGAGTLTGVIVITVSTFLGLFWRRFFDPARAKYRWLNTYLFGVIVHIAMIISMFTLPNRAYINIIQTISLPVMIVYPVATVILALLLLRQEERREFIRSITQGQARYSALFYNNHMPILLIDPSVYTIIDSNRAAQNFYLMSKDELAGADISEIDVSGKEISDYAQLHFRTKHKISSGKIINVEVFNSPITFGDESFIYLMIHDISYRVTIENAIKDSEARLKMLIEKSPYAIFIEAQDRFTYLNNAAVRLFGAESAEVLVGKRVSPRFRSDFVMMVEDIIKKQEGSASVELTEEQCKKLDDTLVPVEMTGTSFYFNGLDSVLIYANDISQKKDMEARSALIESQLRQQQKLEAIGTLAGGIAHEINNPINGIMNYSEIILDDALENSKTSDYAKEIIRETNRISEIVKNLLQFSRQEKQSHSYASIYDIINGTLSLIRTIIKRDQIDLVIDIDEGLPDMKCRSQQIQQIVMNLLTNARDALNAKYPGYDPDKLIILRCQQSFTDERRWITLEVEDHGTGIPEAVGEKMFVPFFSTKPKDKGTGLGLAISFSIAKDHHGELSYTTEEGKYTIFSLRLPTDNGWDINGGQTT